MVARTTIEVILGISASISVLCSLVIILTFAFLREIRTATRHIIICISLADLCTALGYLLSLSFVYASKEKFESSVSMNHLCTIQSFISSTSSLCSFLWTMFFSLALYLVLVKEKVELLRRMLPFLHLFCWMVPLVINIVALSLKKLGVDKPATGDWCWIANDPKPSAADSIKWMFIDGKAIEMFTYVFIIVMSVVILINLRKKIRKASYSAYPCPSPVMMQNKKVQTMRLLYKKLFFIPLLFILIRIWGTVRFIIYLHKGYHEKAQSGAEDMLQVLQVIGDSSQSTVNMLLFCIFTPKIREPMVNKFKSLFSFGGVCCGGGNQGCEGCAKCKTLNRQISTDEKKNLLRPASSGYNSISDAN